MTRLLHKTQDKYGNIDIESEELDITLRPKKKGFPSCLNLFKKIAGEEDHLERNKKVYLTLTKLDFKDIPIEEYVNKLFAPAFAILVREILDEIKKDLKNTSSFHAKTPVANIAGAIDHFTRTNKNSGKYTKAQIAFEVSLNYKSMHSDEPFRYKSVADFLSSK